MLTIEMKLYGGIDTFSGRTSKYTNNVKFISHRRTWSIQKYLDKRDNSNSCQRNVAQSRWETQAIKKIGHKST